MGRRKFFIVCAFLATFTSASTANLEEQLLVAEIPESYSLTVDPDDENTIIVSACNRLATGLPRRCKIVGKVSVEDAKMFRKDIAENIEEYMRIMSSYMVLVFMGGAGAALWLIGDKRIKIPLWGRVVGGFAVFYGSMLYLAPSFARETNLLRETNMAKGSIEGEPALGLFTDFFNRYGTPILPCSISKPQKGKRIRSKHFACVNATSLKSPKLANPASYD